MDMFTENPSKFCIFYVLYHVWAKLEETTLKEAKFKDSMTLLVWEPVVYVDCVGLRLSV